MDQRLGFCSQCCASLNSRGDVIACGRCGLPVYGHTAAINPQSRKVPMIPAAVLAAGFAPAVASTPVAVEPLSPVAVETATVREELRPRRGR